jgi:D-alanine-D-alanine ligase
MVCGASCSTLYKISRFLLQITKFPLYICQNIRFIMKIGIFFGGQSREREISFAGGRTVYDNLNKGLFTPVPIFVDSLGRFILLDWTYIYKGTIRDFYPPVSHTPASDFQVYAESLGKEVSWEEMAKCVGKPVHPHQFPELFDFAFLALHGPYGEDGNIQGILEWYGLPYSGSGILPSAIGIDKAVQRKMLQQLGFPSPKSQTLQRQAWMNGDRASLFAGLQASLGMPFVAKATHQGSSIGVSIVKTADMAQFIKAVDRAFFIEEIAAEQWRGYTDADKYRYIATLVDIRQGIGLPAFMSAAGEVAEIFHPDHLRARLDAHFAASDAPVLLSASDGEDTVLFESFIDGKEFSCIVVQGEDGEALALPPTEIIKSSDVFDYRAKYLPGISRKITPIGLPSTQIRAIQEACVTMYKALHFGVYARIDGFINAAGEIFLNDPNTTSGMMPSSFFFHQAAEIGLNPSQFLTYIIRTSLAERIRTGKRSQHLSTMLESLDARMGQLQAQQGKRIKVAVILGGYSSERHISVESGRNVYEKLASSDKYDPIPVFLTGQEGKHELYILPTNILLKDNADDIKEKVLQALTQPKHEMIAETIEKGRDITEKYAQGAIFVPEPLTYEQLAQRVEVVFIALHGRPGEDGAVQEMLEKVGLPYNGSGVNSSRTTIDKYATNEILAQHGIAVAKHFLLPKKQWEENPNKVLDMLKADFGFPLIAKPADDGCSSAVKKIDNEEDFRAFAAMMFRAQEAFPEGPARHLKLHPSEEFPIKPYILIEELITRKGADHFLEVTGGLLTKKTAQGIEYEVFEPSEALASGGILSLEEKFLAGEGQNITPARFDRNPEKRNRLSEQVRKTLEHTARVLQVEGYARTDAFVRIYGDRAETVIIEVNSLPGMTPATCIFHQTAINGYTPFAFIDKILEFGMSRK